MLRISSDPEFRLCGDTLLARGFREKENDNLYSEWCEDEFDITDIKLIPYYLWGNRGENEMSVYLRIKT